MTWGKILFAIIMFFGIIISFANKNYSMALFFGIAFSIIVWIIKTRPKQPLEARR
jgi:uncharacterized membrane protein